MINGDGTPRVLEFNCRLGDPETQPILMRLDSDLVSADSSRTSGRLTGAQIAWDNAPRSA